MWEQRNRDVKTFDAGFRRWVYDTVFGRKDEPKFVDLGVIKYAAPDKGMFRVDTTTAKDGREVPIEDARARALDFGRQVDHRVQPREEADDRA